VPCTVDADATRLLWNGRERVDGLAAKYRTDADASAPQPVRRVVVVTALPGERQRDRVAGLPS
jgi:hypothetical protein